MRDARFEWDNAKARLNRRKHGVAFEEALSVFSDDRRLTAYDADHSAGEDRWTAIGMSDRLRILVVTYVRREDRIRLVTARRAVAWEQALYETDAI